MSKLRLVQAKAGGDGSGPEDPMLDKRVEALEVEVRSMKDSLGRMEVVFARVEEKLASLATKDDVARAEMRFSGDLSRAELRLSNDIAELKGRVSNLPTTWQIVAILAALLVGVASLVYATDNFLARSRTASAVPFSVLR